MRSRIARLALGLLCLPGCGGGESDSGGGPGGGGLATLPALELWGYQRNDATGLATEAALGPLSLESILESTDRTHALVHVSGFT